MSTPDKKGRSLTSPGFLRAIFGILVTVLAWFGPWAWPAWPAMAVLAIAFSPARPFVALSYDARSVVVVILLAVNVVSWALAAWAIGKVRETRARRSAPIA